MDQAQELKDEVSRVGRLIDAGHRGVPIGGELLIAFGVSLGLLGSLGAAAAFGYLPLMWTPSPFACAAGFLAFAVLFRGVKERLLTTVLATAAAAAAGELAGRAAMAALRASEPALAGSLAMSLIAVPVVMIALGAVIGLWQLKLSAHAASPANHALIGAWTGLTVAMAVTIGLCIIVGVRTNNWFGFMLLPGLFWILWGAGWWMSAVVTQSRWMRVVAAGSWVVALWSATFEFYAPSIVGLAALAIAPGVQLLRESRATHEA